MRKTITKAIEEKVQIEEDREKVEVLISCSLPSSCSLPPIGERVRREHGGGGQVNSNYIEHQATRPE